MSTSSTPAVSSGFTGTSSFSSSLAQVITRAVAFQQLPITQLQNQQSTLTDQQTEVQTLGSDFASLQTAFNAIGSATGSASYSAASSVATVATASLSTGAQAGTYSIAVTAVGAQTNTLSSAGLSTVANPSATDISTSTAFTLTAGSTTYQITNSANTLSGLAAAINASGAPVQATLVNVGGSAAPDYRLSIQGTQYASSAIQLNDGTQNLLTTLSTGSSVQYSVNNSGTTVSSTSRNLAISPGVTLNVLATGSTAITVSQSADALSNAFSNFATAYNTASDEVVKNRGQNGGALAGSPVLLQLSSALSSIGNYSGTASGTINSLADLGLSFDQNGKLQFDSGVFAAATSSSLTAALSFLGSNSGGGYLQAANSALTAVTDPTGGIITQQTQSIAASLSTLTTKISADQTALTAFQTNLTNQMAQADAAIAAIEQQASQITSLFAAEDTISKSLSG